MLKRQKNRLFEVIEEAGLDPNDFSGGQPEDLPLPAFKVSLKGSTVSFTAFPSEDNYDHYTICRTLLAPGFPESELTPDNGFLMPFGAVEREFRLWLDQVVAAYREEKQLPDLWAELTASSAVRELDRDQNWEGNFSDEEKASIRRSMAAFKAALAEEFSPSSSEMKELELHLHYLEAALERLNKFDWRGVALSTLVTMITALSLDTARGRQLVELFRAALSTAMKLVAE